jgi:hypothetical protein
MCRPHTVDILCRLQRLVVRDSQILQNGEYTARRSNQPMTCCELSSILFQQCDTQRENSTCKKSGLLAPKANFAEPR